MANIVNYPIGLQSFSEIRKGGYVYIDKTQYIIPLLRNGKYKFLSRPRRFGKSLLISMLESFFRGDRELFKGLAVDRLLPEEWPKHPVIHLDFSGESYSETEVLEKKLHSSLGRYEKHLGLMPDDKTFSERFRNIVCALHESSGNPVVVLIDEYDNPITSSIGNPALQEYFREVLYGFYSSLKSIDSHLHFCMLTGVTKYGHLSVFSGLNNLMDISFANDFAGICGITEEELADVLGEGVAALAKEECLDINDTHSLLKDWYDGYHFSKGMVDIYNPFSIINALARREVSDYWYQTGTPTILIRAIQDQSIDVAKLNGAKASEDMLNNLSALTINPLALFYQTGYLTIKDYDRGSRLFTLGYPNREVEAGFMDNVLNVFGHISDSKVLVSELRTDLERGQTEGFINSLRQFLSGIPFDLRRNVGKYENYYHTIFYVLLRLIGMDVSAEYHTSGGSVDIVIKTTEYVNLIELKINGTATDAINQIAERGYSLPFSGDRRKIIEVGIGFSETTHTIDSYLIRP